MAPWEGPECDWSAQPAMPPPSLMTEPVGRSRLQKRGKHRKARLTPQEARYAAELARETVQGAFRWGL
jgi:hypothetical protein